VNRIQFQRLAEERVRDAEALLNAGQWSGAYYLAGYAVECALKACIAKQTKLHDFPDKDRVLRSYSHRIEALVEEAGFKIARDRDAVANVALGDNWSAVKDWDEKSRYELWTETEARELFVAVTHPFEGVLPWIVVRW